MTRFSSLLLSLFLAAPAAAQGYVETFDGGTNAGGWGYASIFNVIETSGGNPGAYLRNTLTDTFAPMVFTAPGANPFHGNWRAMGVDGFGVDLFTHSTQFPFQREVTLMLSNGDCTVYWLGTELVPQPGAGWGSFDFVVDSASTTMPAGWTPFGSCTDPDTAWNTVMTGVTEVLVFYGDPTFFYIFDQWDVGMDNARITVEPTGTPLCFGDGSGTACPCSNPGGAGEGCENSAGSGAILAATGGTSVGSDTLSLHASQLPPGKPGLLFSGTTIAGAGQGVHFGDGLRCAGGFVQRLGVRVADGSGDASWGPGVISQAGWNSGETRYLQLWYRDQSVAPCVDDFNTSNAVEVQLTN